MLHLFGLVGGGVGFGVGLSGVGVGLGVGFGVGLSRVGVGFGVGRTRTCSAVTLIHTLRLRSV
jgi:hypothetical protein